MYDLPLALVLATVYGLGHVLAYIAYYHLLLLYENCEIHVFIWSKLVWYVLKAYMNGMMEYMEEYVNLLLWECLCTHNPIIRMLYFTCESDGIGHSHTSTIHTLHNKFISSSFENSREPYSKHTFHPDLHTNTHISIRVLKFMDKLIIHWALNEIYNSGINHLQCNSITFASVDIAATLIGLMCFGPAKLDLVEG